MNTRDIKYKRTYNSIPFHVSEVRTCSKTMKENETKIFCLSSFCKLSREWKNCQVFLFLTYTHYLSVVIYCMLYVYMYNKMKMNCILCYHSFVYERTSIQFICPLQHSSLYGGYTRNSPLTWKMNHVLFTRQQNNEVIKEHKHILS